MKILQMFEMIPLVFCTVSLSSISPDLLLFRSSLLLGSSFLLRSSFLGWLFSLLRLRFLCLWLFDLFGSLLLGLLRSSFLLGSSFLLRSSFLGWLFSLLRLRFLCLWLLDLFDLLGSLLLGLLSLLGFLSQLEASGTLSFCPSWHQFLSSRHPLNSEPHSVLYLLLIISHLVVGQD